MSDENLKVDIGLEVLATGEDIIDVMTRKLDALNRKIKAINSGIASAARGISTTGGAGTSAKNGNGSKSARDALGIDRQAVTELKRKLALETRLANQRSREEVSNLRAFKARMAFQARQTAQTERAEARAIQSRMRDEAQSFRQRFSFGTRIGRQAVQEEKARAREQERSIASAARAESQRMRERAADLRVVSLGVV